MDQASTIQQLVLHAGPQSSNNLAPNDNDLKQQQHSSDSLTARRKATKSNNGGQAKNSSLVNSSMPASLTGQYKRSNGNSSDKSKGLSFSIDSIIGVHPSTTRDMHLIHRHLEQCQRKLAHKQQLQSTSTRQQFKHQQASAASSNHEPPISAHLQQQQQQQPLQQSHHTKARLFSPSSAKFKTIAPTSDPGSRRQSPIRAENTAPPQITPNMMASIAASSASNLNQLFPWFMAFPQVAQFLCQQQQQQQQIINKQDAVLTSHCSNSIRNLAQQYSTNFTNAKNSQISSSRSLNHSDCSPTSGQNTAKLNSQRPEHQHQHQQQQQQKQATSKSSTGINNPSHSEQQQHNSSHRHNKHSPIYDEMKPAHSYIGLIAMCILSTPDKRMVLNDIYQFILDNYAYFRNRGNGWRNSIRHNLSLNDCFQKCGRAANGKGHFWTIHPANMEDFMRGDFRRRRAQRKVRRHMGLHVPSDESNDESDDDVTKPPLPEHFKRSLAYHHKLEQQHQQARLLLQSASNRSQLFIGNEEGANLGGGHPIGPVYLNPTGPIACAPMSSLNRNSQISKLRHPESFLHQQPNFKTCINNLEQHYNDRQLAVDKQRDDILKICSHPINYNLPGLDMIDRSHIPSPSKNSCHEERSSFGSSSEMSNFNLYKKVKLHPSSEDDVSDGTKVKDLSHATYLNKLLDVSAERANYQDSTLVATTYNDKIGKIEQKIDDATSSRHLNNLSPMTSLVSLSKSLSPANQSPLNLISTSLFPHTMNEINHLDDWNPSNLYSKNIVRSNGLNNDRMSDNSDDCDTEINVASPMIRSSPSRSSPRQSPLSPIFVSSPRPSRYSSPVSMNSDSSDCATKSMKKSKNNNIGERSSKSPLICSQSIEERKSNLSNLTSSSR